MLMFRSISIDLVHTVLCRRKAPSIFRISPELSSLLRRTMKPAQLKPNIQILCKGYLIKESSNYPYNSVHRSGSSCVVNVYTSALEPTHHDKIIKLLFHVIKYAPSGRPRLKSTIQSNV